MRSEKSERTLRPKKKLFIIEEGKLAIKGNN